MKLMKILLLGKTGLLGSEFREILENKKTDFLAPTRKELNVLNFEKVADFFAKNKVDLIIYCVAWTDVDGAEKFKEECHVLNVKALKNILQYKIPIIHFSTDYIFDAKKDDEITENFPRNPLNYYGQSKLEAEKLLENFARKWWNIRTTWLFGKGGKNFISTILEKAQTEKVLEIVNDEIGRPTSAKDLAEYIFAEFIEKEKPSGHYHLQNTGEPVSWSNLARFCFENLSPNLKVNISKSGLVFPKIKEISAKKLNRAAKRPINSVLENTKLKNELQDWQEAVRDFLIQTH
jgi:dTDP-4-dehydrorhamnose reductase